MENNKVVVNIYPTKRIKRFLSCLADIGLMLIVSITLFELVCMPIFRGTPTYANLNDEHLLAERNRTEILYDNDILKYTDATKYVYSRNLVESSNSFLKFYVFDQSDNTLDVNYNYFVKVRGEDVSYLNEIYLKEANEYFDDSKFTSIGTYDFKENIKILFSPLFIEGDELSKDAQKKYDEFHEKIFLNIYKYVMLDISKNDVKSPVNLSLKSYLDYSNIVVNTEKQVNNTYVICAYASFGFSALIFFFVIPLISSRGQTISERVLKLERVYKKDMNYLNKLDVVVTGLYNTINSSIILFLTPFITVGFIGLFNLPLLTTVSLVGFVFLILELMLMLFTPFNQTLKEYSTRSIVCDSYMIDEFYKAKGYDL